MALINFVRDYERIARFRLGKFEGMMKRRDAFSPLP